jgi:predicted ArsR family transcriptional regulator
VSRLSELATAVGVTDNAVRLHLGSLQREGLVRQSGVRRSVGKPAHVYDVTLAVPRPRASTSPAVLQACWIGVTNR